MWAVQVSLCDFAGVLCFPFLVLETSCHCLFPYVQLLSPSSAMFPIPLPRPSCNTADAQNPSAWQVLHKLLAGVPARGNKTLKQGSR